MAAERRALIVLLIDPDSYESESGKKLTPEYVHEQGGYVNEDAAGMLGYEGWITIPDAPAELVEQLGVLNFKPEEAV